MDLKNGYDQLPNNLPIAKLEVSAVTVCFFYEPNSTIQKTAQKYDQVDGLNLLNVFYKVQSLGQFSKNIFVNDLQFQIGEKDIHIFTDKNYCYDSGTNLEKV